MENQGSSSEQLSGDGISASNDGESSREQSLASNEASLEPIKEVPDPVTKKCSNEEANALISKQFPDAREYLKRRLADSIESRNELLSHWRDQDEDVRASRQTAKEENDALNLNPGEPNSWDSFHYGMIKWANLEYFSKPPVIVESQPNVTCTICFLSMPKKEATGDLWT